MTNCPYCDCEVDDTCREYHETGYDCMYDSQWTEFRAVCPHCGKEFRWLEVYTRAEDEIYRMDE